MKRIISLLLCLYLFPSLLLAESQEEKRKIEEEKRHSLRSSEIYASREKEVAPQPAVPLEPEDLIYFIELTPKRITYGYDACKAIVVLMGVEYEYIDLNSQTAFLKEKKLLPKKIESEFDPMQPLRKGVAAYMFCKALGIKGGITLRLLGMNQRYAIKELSYEGIMSSGNTNDIVSGEELVSIVTQAADYKSKREQTSKPRPKK